MKAVLISIRPKWCEQIVAGTKKLEIRKTRPVLETPFKCYMYQTKIKWAFDFLKTIGFDEFAEVLERGFTKVIGEFTCDYIFPITVDCNVHDELPGSPVETWLTWDDAPGEYETVQALTEAACLSYDEISRYIGRGDGCFAWHISNRVIYKRPKPLSWFVTVGECDCMNCESCVWLEKGNGFDIEEECQLVYEHLNREESLKPIFRPTVKMESGYRQYSGKWTRK